MTKSANRKAIVVSDRTGLTGQALAHSLVSQFPTIGFESETLAFIDTVEKANTVIERCQLIEQQEGHAPLLFITIVNEDIREIFTDSNFPLFDLFDTFIGPMEKALEMESSHKVGRSHGVTDTKAYTSRMAAVHFALQTDDGMDTDHYGNSDLIIVGVSRCGKTPTSLYLSLQLGLYVSNYPLTEEDLRSKELPAVLLDNRNKLFGLTIDPYRLLQIRQERYAGSSYSPAETCQREVAQAESMFRGSQVPYLNTTKMSIEEIGAMILHRTGLRSRVLQV